MCEWILRRMYIVIMGVFECEFEINYIFISRNWSSNWILCLNIFFYDEIIRVVRGIYIWV